MRPTACTFRGDGASLLTERVRASLVIVGRVRSQQMAEMPLAEHDNVVKTFPPDRTDRPFTISVLPRRSRRGWPIPNAHRPKAADEDVTVDGVAVTNDVSRRYFPTIGLGELVRNPFSRWVRGHSQPQDLATIVNVVRPAHRSGAASTAARSSGIDMRPLALAISTSAYPPSCWIPVNSWLRQ